MILYLLPASVSAETFYAVFKVDRDRMLARVSWKRISEAAVTEQRKGTSQILEPHGGPGVSDEK